MPALRRNASLIRYSEMILSDHSTSRQILDQPPSWQRDKQLQQQRSYRVADMLHNRLAVFE